MANKKIERTFEKYFGKISEGRVATTLSHGTSTLSEYAMRILAINYALEDAVYHLDYSEFHLTYTLIKDPDNTGYYLKVNESETLWGSYIGCKMDHRTATSLKRFLENETEDIIWEAMELSDNIYQKHYDACGGWCTPDIKASPEGGFR